MPGSLRIALLLMAIPLGMLSAGEQPFDPADLLTPPASEPKATADGAAADTARQPLPAADALKAATAAIKDLYKGEYATPKSRAALVSTLVDQALQTNDDPAMRYALLNEARELAITAKSVAPLLEICEQIAAGYAGDTATDLKRAALGRVSGVSVTSHLIKLLDAPDDAFANTAVGRWYANEVQQWERALPHLIKGSDQTLAKAANAELALTDASKPADQTAVADQWYELGKRTITLKESFWRHALGLYELAKPRLSGLNVTILEKRIAEIEDFLPLGPDIDFSSLSAGQWEKLKGKLITVDAGKGINATSITLTAGQKIRVVPHPTDTWKVDDRGNILTATWKGGMAGRRAVGSLQCRVGTGIEQTPGIITGTGQLSLFPLAMRRMVVSGTIRVKILPVTE
jgi:hypothetical protein